MQTQLKLKSRSSAQYAYNRYLKNNSFEAQKSSGRPPNCQKNQKKKLVADVLKDPRTSLERIRVAHNAFSCYDTISRGTVRRILKKIWRFFKKCCKIQFEEEKQVFSFKMVYQYAQEAVLSGRMWFLLMKQGCHMKLLKFVD